MLSCFFCIASCFDQISLASTNYTQISIKSVGIIRSDHSGFQWKYHHFYWLYKWPNKPTHWVRETNGKPHC
uniref:Putative secreted protein n=1 Tax=Anopheles darlingi TaxID=43151 RepID=A0A2M4D8G0_ANODA